MNYAAKSRIIRPVLSAGKRILVISDVHANLPYLKSALDAVGYCRNDVLIFDGDFLEKGPDSLETLRYIMDLKRENENVYAVCGNCDDWAQIFTWDRHHLEHVTEYVKARGRGLLWDMLYQAGIEPLTMSCLEDWLEALQSCYQDEWSFLGSIPHAIETGHYIFAHASVVQGKALEEHRPDELIRCDAFMNGAPCFDKWIIVGHWPVVLYGSDRVCANPVIDRERKIISIDGGCVLKDDGQLNVLIIPFEGSEDFDWLAYDPFPSAVCQDPQTEGKVSYYIRWGDSTVEVLERGEEFSRCRHIRTGYEMDILTKYLFTGQHITGCNDCSDYVPALKPGDVVKVIEESSRGYYIKHNGVSGWYSGRLTFL